MIREYLYFILMGAAVIGITIFMESRPMDYHKRTDEHLGMYR